MSDAGIHFCQLVATLTFLAWLTQLQREMGRLAQRCAKAEGNITHLETEHVRLERRVQVTERQRFGEALEEASGQDGPYRSADADAEADEPEPAPFETGQTVDVRLDGVWFRAKFCGFSSIAGVGHRFLRLKCGDERPDLYAIHTVEMRHARAS